MPHLRSLKSFRQQLEASSDRASPSSSSSSTSSSSFASFASDSQSFRFGADAGVGSCLDLPSFQDFVQEVKKQRRRSQVRDASRRLRQRQQEELDSLKTQVHELENQVQVQGRQLQHKDSLIRSLCAAIDQRDAALSAVAASCSSREGGFNGMRSSSSSSGSSSGSMSSSSLLSSSVLTFEDMNEYSDIHVLGHVPSMSFTF